MKKRIWSASSLMCLVLGLGLAGGCSSDEDDDGSTIETGGAAGEASGGSGGSTGGSGGSMSTGGTAGAGTGGTGAAPSCDTVELGNSADCTTCLRTNCCLEMQDCAANGCVTLSECARACPEPENATLPCFRDCVAPNPSAEDYWFLMVSCKFEKCTGQDVDGGSAGAAGGSPTPAACFSL